MKDLFYLYLAGPITDASYEGCTDWRLYVSSKLPASIQAISPMRGKTYLQNEKQIQASYEDIPLSSGKGITRRDRFDVRRSNAVLINLLGAKKISIGSVIEVGWADDGIKPIILVMEKEGNPHDHPMLKEIASYIVDDLDDAIVLARKILLPGV